MNYNFFKLYIYIIPVSYNFMNLVCLRVRVRIRVVSSVRVSVCGSYIKVNQKIFFFLSLHLWLTHIKINYSQKKSEKKGERKNF